MTDQLSATSVLGTTEPGFEPVAAELDRLLAVLLLNIPAVRRSGQAAAAAVCSASELARLYAMCVSEVDGMPRILSPETVAEVTQIRAVGDDLILRCPTRYGVVFQKADDRLPFGSHQAFGHDGAGVADPWHGVACARIPRRTPFASGGDGRGLGLARILRGCLPSQP
jgi:hypothetical protein